MDLKQSLKTLAMARRTEEIISNHIADIQTMLQNSPAGQALMGFKRDLAAAKDTTTTAEAAVRTTAKDQYFVDLNKAPAPGVRINLHREVDHDPAQLLAWCKVNAPTLVEESLKKDFLKAVVTLPFAPISFRYEPQPQIAADLSQYLAGEEKQKEPETNG